jgi:hypothetical protein
MEDSGSLEPISKRLERLRAYERAGNALSWVERTDVPASNSPPISESHRDGVLAVLEQVPGEGCFRVVCHRWPALLRGVVYKTWAWDFHGPATAKYVLKIDPKHDLAVILVDARTETGRDEMRYFGACSTQPKWNLTALS